MTVSSDPLTNASSLMSSPEFRARVTAALVFKAKVMLSGDFNPVIKGICLAIVRNPLDSKTIDTYVTLIATELPIAQLFAASNVDQIPVDDLVLKVQEMVLWQATVLSDAGGSEPIL